MLGSFNTSGGVGIGVIPAEIGMWQGFEWCGGKILDMERAGHQLFSQDYGKSNPCCWRHKWKFTGRFEGRNRNDHLDLVQEEPGVEFLSPWCVIKQHNIHWYPELPKGSRVEVWTHSPNPSWLPAQNLGDSQTG